MEKSLIASILLLSLATACSKIVDPHEPPVVTHPDTALYNVTTVKEVEAHILGLAIADDGTIFYSAGNKIYKIKGSTKSLLAGGEEAGLRDGPGASALFNLPTRMAVHADGSLYVNDSYNKKLRKIDPSGNVSTVVFSFVDSIYDKYGKLVEVRHDTTSRMGAIFDVNIKNNHLYLMCNGYSTPVHEYNTLQCRLDSNYFLSKRYNLFITQGEVRSFDISQDEQYLYWCSIYGLEKFNLITGKEAPSYDYNDRDFPNFALGEEDSIVYKPRLDKCIIERTPLATGKDSLIAGQINTAPMNIPHLSKDGIGVQASFNYITLVKKKNNYLYIAESDYYDDLGGKIRKMRVP
ncbi:hypothetical protein [Chitinophaga sp.]|uniref:hypothetical protein n=1 Tax=Chitinophaga sp. TaxID=1869181 RepID=UPI002F931005